MKRKYKKFIIIFFAFLAVAALLFVGQHVVTELQYEAKYDQIFTSPNRITTVLVRYDYMSRPSVFLESGKRIFKYSGPGFMETIQFDVDWVNDYKLNLFNNYFNESYTIEIP